MAQEVLPKKKKKTNSNNGNGAISKGPNLKNSLLRSGVLTRPSITDNTAAPEPMIRQTALGQKALMGGMGARNLPSASIADMALHANQASANQTGSGLPNSHVGIPTIQKPGQQGGSGARRRGTYP